MSKEREQFSRIMKELEGKNPSTVRHPDFPSGNNCEAKLKKYYKVLLDAEQIIDGMHRFSAPRSEVFKKEWIEMDYKAKDWLETWMERLK